MKEIINEKKRIIIDQISIFCDEKLDEEYKELCIKMAEKMARKRAVPFLTGKLEIWSASIIYTIGQINFLFDKSFEPYATPDDICSYFGTTKSTTSQKAKLIRDMFKLRHYDNEFSTKKIKKDNPFNDMWVLF